MSTKCVGCYKDIDGVPTVLNGGESLCPVCTFIIAVYTENGITKRFCHGDLMYHKISNNIKKAVDLFMVNPRLAYEMFLPNMIKRMSGYKITEVEMDRLIDESFPFVKLSIEDAERFELSVGSEFRCITDNGRSLCRHIYAMRKFTRKESIDIKQGSRSFVALFLPKED